MADQTEYRRNRARVTNELETEDATTPQTKRILLYGWDGTNKVRIAVDASGYLKIDSTNLDTRYLLIDQTTPQTVINDAPTFDAGVKLSAGEKLIFDA